MNPSPPQPPPPTTPRRGNMILGPRPTPLKVSKDSFKIKKPPKHPHALPHTAPAPPPPENQPVIIYSVSPKPYYVEVSDFRSLVQHLTGRDTSSPVATTSEPPPSPAARLAAQERTSPKERRRRDVSMTTEVNEYVSQMPGILSPAPANLPVISAEMFSPAGGDGFGYFGSMSELMSPFMSNTVFLPSPSGLLFCNNAPIVSPSPNGEFFNIFDF